MLLHRPDTLFEAKEVAKAFNELKESGKVREFGLSNCNGGQIKLLQKYLDFPLIANQLEFGPVHTPMIDSGINVNMKNADSINHEDSILEFCRYEDITIQTWSPFQIDLSQGLFINHPDYMYLTMVLNDYAKKYNSSLEPIVTAWILRHPANMQMIAGTMNTDRLEKISEGLNIRLSIEEWYEVYRSAGNRLP